MSQVTDMADVLAGGILSVELTSGITDITAERVAQSPGGGITVLATMHGLPLGQVVVRPGADGMSAVDLADTLWTQLPEVAEHLQRDGIELPSSLDPRGAGATEEPRCLEHRRRVLANPPSFTVLIATRDRTDSLLRCLASVAMLDYPLFDVVVVDSAPETDTTRSAIEAMNGRLGEIPLHYVYEPRPGLALAHNSGMSAVTGEWVAITDDDVIVDHQWLAALAEGTTRDPNVACVTGLIMPAELLTPAQLLLEQYGGFSRGFTPRLFDQGDHRPDDPLFPLTAGRFGSGANMAFRVDALRSEEPFDPVLGAGTLARGGDDLAAFLRVIRDGYALAYEPGAILWHHHRREYTGLQRQARNYGTGLGAYLTDAVIHDPRMGWLLIRHGVAAIAHMVSKSSAKNANKRDGFPRELERAERFGVLLGPLAYVRSRLHARRQR